MRWRNLLSRGKLERIWPSRQLTLIKQNIFIENNRENETFATSPLKIIRVARRVGLSWSEAELGRALNEPAQGLRRVHQHWHPRGANYCMKWCSDELHEWWLELGEKTNKLISSIIHLQSYLHHVLGGVLIFEYLHRLGSTLNSYN